MDDGKRPQSTVLSDGEVHVARSGAEASRWKWKCGWRAALVHLGCPDNASQTGRSLNSRKCVSPILEAGRSRSARAHGFAVARKCFLGADCGLLALCSGRGMRAGLSSGVPFIGPSPHSLGLPPPHDLTTSQRSYPSHHHPGGQVWT